MIIRTTNQKEEPICPICELPVSIEGQFCSPGCWEEFHIIIYDMAEPIIDMNYIDLEAQPWYGKHHG